MLYNFIIKDGGDKPLEGLRWRTVDAISEHDAIQIYILDDSVEDSNILKLIDIYLEENNNEEEYNIGESLFNKFDDATGIEVDDGFHREINDERYKRFLHDNLDEIEELIDEMNGLGYFVILKLSDIITESAIKSARKI